MKFRKFNSIENSYQKAFIQSIFDRGFSEIDYVVQEKTHGANLSFITNGKEVKSAKRTELIADDENFYNSKAVLEKHKDRVIELFWYLSKEFKLNTLTIFGELIGGGYPHKDVPISKEAKLVQRGIYYSPENEFFAFDILVNGEQYLEVALVNSLFEKFNFSYAATLFRGSLKECLQYPNKFKSTLPAKFGLPELEGNICEGVIIRPVKPLFFNSGARVIIKNKNEDWSENNNYIDKQILKKLLNEEEQLSEQAENLCKEAYKYISSNRLNNVLSKIGEVNPAKDYGKVLGMFNKDILTDFLKENQAEYKALEKHESKAINKFINKHASLLLAEFFT
ncbi:MAG: RNA ligase family protein [Mesonia hippocampi]|uniref:RNA ligase family protein n=1 Tax=Mesonia hippocampi TaxID=1628250 RepID=UPI003F9DB21C